MNLLRTWAGLDRIDGTASLTAVLSGSGHTQQEMVSTLEGAAGINVGMGGIRGLDASAMAAAVREAPLTGWPMQDTSVTKFDSLSVKAGIADGIVSLSELKLDGAAIALTGKGEVDLLRPISISRRRSRRSRGTPSDTYPGAAAMCEAKRRKRPPEPANRHRRSSTRRSTTSPPASGSVGSGNQETVSKLRQLSETMLRVQSEPFDVGAEWEAKAGNSNIGGTASSRHGCAVSARQVAHDLEHSGIPRRRSKYRDQARRRGLDAR